MLMNFEEVNGIQTGFGLKVVMYGQEGVGKSSLASQLPDPVFIDCEGSTSRMNVRRLPKPTSWQMFTDEVEYVLANAAAKGYKSLVVDTFDWAERLALEALCTEHKVSGIEGMNYGKGWEFEKEMIGRFLDRTDRLIAAGINVVLLCHAITRKTTLPEEMEEYDHWELKLGSKTTNKIAPLLKEWSDMTLFLAFRTNIEAIDDKGKKHKATSCERVMYTTKTAWWDAKNRFGLPDRLPLAYESIAGVFAPSAPAQPPVQPPAQELISSAQAAGIQTAQVDLASFDQIYPPENTAPEKPAYQRVTGIPDALADLMQQYNVTAQQVEYVSIDLRHYMAKGMKIQQFPQDYLMYLTTIWDQVVSLIQQNCSDYVPF
jgi:hypothetical protein